MQFASSMSLLGGRKYVILDEADYLIANSTQPALRNFMEEYSSNCGFILTCNFINRIIDPLHSRCSVIEFKIGNKEKAELAKQFLSRATTILDQESVTYDKKAIAEVIMKHFPDWRRVLNELQRYSIRGSIDTGILANSESAEIGQLIKHLKAREFESMRKWVGMNSSTDVNKLFRKIYDTASEHIKAESIPSLVLTLADYQYKSSFVVDQEINLAACLTQIMADCEFK
jgi:DNA polymerase III delta prime subunit